MISVLFNANNEKDFINTLDKICEEATLAISKGYTFIILSDKGVNKSKVALPILMAIGAVHHHLVKKALRQR